MKAEEEHYGWDVFIGTFLGAILTVGALAAAVGAIWGWALGTGLVLGLAAGAAAGGSVGFLLGHVPASQRSQAKRQQMAFVMAGLISVPFAVVALLGLAVGVVRELV